MVKLEMFRNGIWDLLRNITDDMDEVFRPLADRRHLTMIQLRVLVEIAQEEEQTIGVLSKAIGLTAGNASAMCKRLEQAGFLGRRRDPQDERMVKLALTPKGADAVADVENFFEDAMGTLLQNRDEKDFAEIYNGLRKLKDIFEDLKRVPRAAAGRPHRL